MKLNGASDNYEGKVLASTSNSLQSQTKSASSSKLDNQPTLFPNTLKSETNHRAPKLKRM